MRVSVYRNLNKGIWSIKALEGASKGKVIAHLEALTLVNATCKVSEASRQRVLRDRQRNVHASIVGTLVDTYAIKGSSLRYNPYTTNGHFVDTETSLPLSALNAVHFTAVNTVIYN